MERVCVTVSDYYVDENREFVEYLLRHLDGVTIIATGLYESDDTDVKESLYAVEWDDEASAAFHFLADTDMLDIVNFSNGRDKRIPAALELFGVNSVEELIAEN